MDSVDDSISDTSENISTETTEAIISDLDSIVCHTDTLSKSNTDDASEPNTNPCPNNISPNAGYPTNAAWYSKFFKPKSGFSNRHVCLYCNTEVSGTKNNLSNLTRHLKYSKKCCRRYNEFLKDQSKCKYRTPISIFLGLLPHVLSNLNVDNAVKRMIIIDEYPINAVEKPGLQQLMTTALPGYHLPSRNSIMNRLEKDMSNYEERMTKRFLEFKFVSLVIDGWSNRRMQSFIGVVAHGIHKDKFKQETFIVECEYFGGRHTHDRLAVYIVKFIEKYGIIHKLVRIGTDSAAVMRKAFKSLLIDAETYSNEEDTISVENAANLLDNLLDDIEPIDEKLVIEAVKIIYSQMNKQMDDNNPLNLLQRSKALNLNLHFRCSCHWLQRAIVDFLNGMSNQRKRLISKARRFTASVRKSTIDFPMLVKNNCFIPSPNVTRWGSLYKMLGGILQVHNKGLVDHIHSVKKANYFTSSEIRYLQEVYQILGYVHKLTVNLESNTASPGMLIPALEWVEESLKEEKSDNADCLITVLKQRFDNDDWKGDTFIQLATLVDPRYALQWINESSQFKELLLNAVEALTCVNVEKEIDHTQIDSMEAIPLNQTSPNTKRKRLDTFWAGVSPSINTEYNYDPAIQIESFVKEIKSSDSSYKLSVDPLQWYSSRGDSNFPSIKLLLCSPSSTSSVERLFSICSRINTSDRARMSTESLRMMTLLKAEWSK